MNKLLIIVVAILLAIPTAFAALTCTIAAGNCAAGATNILKFSNSTDAHTEFANQSNYPINLCCTDSNGATMGIASSGVLFLRLSNGTDAHAELPNGSSYADGAYLSASSGTLACTYPAASGICPADNACLGTISADTDAHLANCSSGAAYETTICCSLTAASSSSSSGGGGGGSRGGGTTTSSTTTTPAAAGGEAAPETTTSFEALTPNKPVQITTSETISSITFTPQTLLENVKVSVVVSNAPSSAPVFSGPVYQVLHIIETNIPKDAVKDVQLRFNVLRSWLEERKLHSSEISLYRLQDEWKEQPTFIEKEDGVYVYYATKSSGLSYFLIGPRGKCDDGAKNQNEIGVDCGGVCGSCLSGSQCSANIDCKSGNCFNGFCSSIGVGCKDNVDCGSGFSCKEGTCTTEDIEHISSAIGFSIGELTTNISTIIRDKVIHSFQALTKFLKNAFIWVRQLLAVILSFIFTAISSLAAHTQKIIWSLIIICTTTIMGFGSYHTITLVRRSFMSHKRSKEQATDIARAQHQVHIEKQQRMHEIATKLSSFIQSGLDNNYSEQKIKEILIKKGYPEKIIDSYLNYFLQQKSKQEKDQKSESYNKELQYLSEQITKLDKNG